MTKWLVTVISTENWLVTVISTEGRNLQTVEFCKSFEGYKFRKKSNLNIISPVMPPVPSQKCET